MWCRRLARIEGLFEPFEFRDDLLFQTRHVSRCGQITFQPLPGVPFVEIEAAISISRAVRSAVAALVLPGVDLLEQLAAFTPQVDVLANRGLGGRLPPQFISFR